MSRFIEDCTGVILAGGENIRMPVLKAFIEVDGEKIIERNVKIIKRLFQEVFIVTNQPELYVYLGLGVKLLGDIYNVRGPMTGILTSLINSSNNWVFIAACDMPFINKDLIRYMGAKRDAFGAVVSKSPHPPFTKGGMGGYIEPLFAFYSKSLLPFMEESMRIGKTGINDFLKDKEVKCISMQEIRRIEGGERSFINLNTPEDIVVYLSPQDVLKFKKATNKGGAQCCQE